MPNRTIYFDTDLYSMMAYRSDAVAVAAWLADRQFSLRASHQTLFEILAISNADRRATELAIVKALAKQIETQPLAYRQAAEVRRAIRRFHPDWLCQNPNIRGGSANLDRLLSGVSA